MSGLKFDQLSAIGAVGWSHPTRGEWIEIMRLDGHKPDCRCLTPHGVSGLKSLVALACLLPASSHPTRGEWIEMLTRLHSVTLPTSHPTRGEWIEIIRRSNMLVSVMVSPHTG